jgi:prevent-host-death family protein
MSTSVSLRELRHEASELLRRVEQGEEIVITVAGRPSARLIPSRPARWRPWSAVEDLFSGPEDQHWAADRELLADDLRDPWAER